MIWKSRSGPRATEPNQRHQLIASESTAFEPIRKLPSSTFRPPLTALFPPTRPTQVSRRAKPSRFVSTGEANCRRTRSSRCAPLNWACRSLRTASRATPPTSPLFKSSGSPVLSRSTNPDSRSRSIPTPTRPERPFPRPDIPLGMPPQARATDATHTFADAENRRTRRCETPGTN